MSLMFAFRWFFFVTLGFSTAVGQEGSHSEQDPHSPPCTDAQCQSVKSFVKTHYCRGLQGYGHDYGCEIRQPTEHPNFKVLARYECEWADGVRHCKQQGELSRELREIFFSKLRGLGLPAKPKEQIFFTVWKPIGLEWSLVEAYYDHIEGSDMTLCQVIAIVGQNSGVSLLRKVPFQKTDADKNTVTTWSPVDLADVNADGQTDIILEGDAYEERWVEVVDIKDGSLRTIFSGLRYDL
jgi:hypothetical protein